MTSGSDFIDRTLRSQYQQSLNANRSNVGQQQAQQIGNLSASSRRLYAKRKSSTAPVSAYQPSLLSEQPTELIPSENITEALSNISLMEQQPVQAQPAEEGFNPVELVTGAVENIMKPFIWMNDHLDKPWASLLATSMSGINPDAKALKQRIEDLQATGEPWWEAAKKAYDDTDMNGVLKFALESTNPIYYLPFGGQAARAVSALPITAKVLKTVGKLPIRLKGLPQVKNLAGLLDESNKAKMILAPHRSYDLVNELYRLTKPTVTNPAIKLSSTIVDAAPDNLKPIMQKALEQYNVTSTANVTEEYLSKRALQRVVLELQGGKMSIPVGEIYKEGSKTALGKANVLADWLADPTTRKNIDWSLLLDLADPEDVAVKSTEAQDRIAMLLGIAEKKSLAERFGVKYSNVNELNLGQDIFNFWRSAVLFTPWYVMQNYTEDIMRSAIWMSKPIKFGNFEVPLIRIPDLPVFGDVWGKMSKYKDVMPVNLQNQIVGLSLGRLGITKASQARRELSRAIQEYSKLAVEAKTAGKLGRAYHFEQNANQLRKMYSSIPDTPEWLSSTADTAYEIIGGNAITAPSAFERIGLETGKPLILWAKFLEKASGTDLPLADKMRGLYREFLNTPRSLANHIDVSTKVKAWEHYYLSTRKVMNKASKANQINFQTVARAIINDYDNRGLLTKDQKEALESSMGYICTATNAQEVFGSMSLNLNPALNKHLLDAFGESAAVSISRINEVLLKNLPTEAKREQIQLILKELFDKSIADKYKNIEGQVASSKVLIQQLKDTLPNEEKSILNELSADADEIKASFSEVNEIAQKIAKDFNMAESPETLSYKRNMAQLELDNLTLQANIIKGLQNALAGDREALKLAVQNAKTQQYMIRKQASDKVKQFRESIAPWVKTDSVNNFLKLKPEQARAMVNEWIELQDAAGNLELTAPLKLVLKRFDEKEVKSTHALAAALWDNYSIGARKLYNEASAKIGEVFSVPFKSSFDEYTPKVYVKLSHDRDHAMNIVNQMLDKTFPNFDNVAVENAGIEANLFNNVKSWIPEAVGELPWPIRHDVKKVIVSPIAKSYYEAKSKILYISASDKKDFIKPDFMHEVMHNSFDLLWKDPAWNPVLKDFLLNVMPDSSFPNDLIAKEVIDFGFTSTSAGGWRSFIRNMIDSTSFAEQAKMSGTPESKLTEFLSYALEERYYKSVTRDYGISLDDATIKWIDKHFPQAVNTEIDIDRNLSNLMSMQDEIITAIQKTNAGISGDVVDEIRASNTAMDMANGLMGDYNSTSEMDKIMSKIFPFWFFPSRSIPFYLRTAVEHPWTVASIARYEAATKDDPEKPPSLLGYVRVPVGGDHAFYINPFRPWMGYQMLNTETLAGKGQPLGEQITTAMSMLGFGMHPAVNISLELANKISTSMGMPNITRGEPRPLLPQFAWAQNAIGAATGTAVPDPFAALVGKTFPDWYEKNLEKAVAAKQVAAIQSGNTLAAQAYDVSTIRQRVADGDATAIRIWKNAVKEVSALGLVSIIAPIYKYRQAEELSYLKSERQTLNSLGITDEMITAAKDQGYSPWLMLNRQQRHEVEAAHPEWKPWRAVTSLPMNPEERKIAVQTEAFYDVIETEKTKIREELDVLDSVLAAGQITPKQWREQFQAKQENMAAASEAAAKYYPLALSDNKKVQEYRSRYNKTIPPVHPEDEAINFYYSIRPELDPITGELDFDTYENDREAFLEGLSPKLREYVESDLIAPKYESSIEKLYRQHKTLMKPYRQIKRNMYNQFPEYEQLVKEYNLAKAYEPDRAAIIYDRLKLYNSYSDELKKQMRLADAELEAMLIFWGYLSKPINPQTPAYYDKLIQSIGGI